MAKPEYCTFPLSTGDTKEEMVNGLQSPSVTGLRLSKKGQNQHSQESGAVSKFRNLIPKMTLDTLKGKRKAL